MNDEAIGPPVFRSLDLFFFPIVVMLCTWAGLRIWQDESNEMRGREWARFLHFWISSSHTTQRKASLLFLVECATLANKSKGNSAKGEKNNISASFTPSVRSIGVICTQDRSPQSFSRIKENQPISPFLLHSPPPFLPSSSTTQLRCLLSFGLHFSPLSNISTLKMSAAHAARKAPTFFQTWFRVEVIPIYAVLGVACGGAGNKNNHPYALRWSIYVPH